jgi:hypothetical protein
MNGAPGPSLHVHQDHYDSRGEGRNHVLVRRHGSPEHAVVPTARPTFRFLRTAFLCR